MRSGRLVKIHAFIGFKNMSVTHVTRHCSSPRDCESAIALRGERYLKHQSA